MEEMRLICGDALEELQKIPSESVDLVLTDPPYNIAVRTQLNGKTKVNEWDRIEDYISWSIFWISECARILKPTGVLYFWHNDIAQIAEILHGINRNVDLRLVSFCVWDKGDSYRARTWKDRRPSSTSALRSWFNICEYCLHFFKEPKAASSASNRSGTERINSNPECYKPIKEYYAAEVARLGLSPSDIARKYTAVTGKKPYMLRHYFCDSQFGIPTKAVWDTVYRPLGFRREYEDLRREYEDLRREYEDLRREYEDLRNVHVCDSRHCNVWHLPPIPSAGRLHTCQKPVEILERLIRVSSRPGATVLDCFMGSGSTGVACLHSGRNFVGIERDPVMYQIAAKRISDEEQNMEAESQQQSFFTGG